ncbi:MAG: hypothetical protein KatS3mg108_2771 [Isosphaeraceae bacterium]|jgi:hypothetical protein|nr:MAG: hypothetical protein KatS3mg108_2771 [Isosphaeraceae bacterium]
MRTKPQTDPAWRRRRVGEAVRLWGGIALGGVLILGGLTIWHLKRRGWLVRERLGPPRDVEWPDGPR